MTCTSFHEFLYYFYYTLERRKWMYRAGDTIDQSISWKRNNIISINLFKTVLKEDSGIKSNLDKNFHVFKNYERNC